MHQYWLKQLNLRLHLKQIVTRKFALKLETSRIRLIREHIYTSSSYILVTRTASAMPENENGDLFTIIFCDIIVRYDR
jgi:hypothetical protein